MATVDVEMLLSVLGEQGQAVAVLKGEEVVAANSAAARLGDLPSLARRAMGAPELVRPDRDHAWEVRAVARDGITLLLGRDVRDREELRENLARSDEILSLASHELKGPLHVLGMICHLLENRAARGDALDKGTIDRLRRQVARLNRLINQLLDASRVQEGRLQLDVEQTDLAETVREELAQIDAGRASDLTVEAPAEAVLRGDRARLTEVVHQLIDNSLRFTSAGTPIRISLLEQGGAWVLTVADQGPGILPADRETLFNRRVRLDRRRGPQGLGLGLFLAAAVARLHQGTLRHEPTVPTGATFILRLPK